MTNDSIQHDLYQRALALDASKSFIVQAPAGSGKTELLIQRFLTLLNHVKVPEEILAITFTKKAANEMRARVIKALKSGASDPEPASEHAKQTWQLARGVLARDQQFDWQLLNNPNQMRIQTIDSLCAFLTRQLPLLSHFGSQPDIALNASGLYREAAHEVLQHVEQDYAWSQAISLLLLHLDNDLNKLHDLLIALLAKRDQWLPYIKFDSHDDDIKAELEQHLAAVIQDSLGSLVAIFPTLLSQELMTLANFAANNLTLANMSSPILACLDTAALPTARAADKFIWLGLAKLLLTEEGQWRKAFNVNLGFPAPSSSKNPLEKSLYADMKQRMADIMKCFHEHDAVRVALAELASLPDPTYQPQQWRILQALLQVLKVLAAQCRVTFQQHGQIDFIENAQAAIAALGNEDTPTDLALALDYQIRHILVDEFQDTSFTQYQLVEKLTMGWQKDDGRTLFVVGDPMQSIYRFRQAEVGLFIRMCKNGLGNIPLIPLTLALNFRSDPAIVNWNNHHFNGIFPTFNDIASGAVTYSACISNKTPLSETHSQVSVHGFTDGTDEIQAAHIIELINQTRTQHPAEKIALLVRSRSHLAAIIPALKAAHIPYRAVAIDPLASRQSIQDLLSLTCALIHPADRIAWLAVLRAPWCGLLLADLLVIAGDNAYTTIWEQLTNKTTKQRLSIDGQQRLANILPILTVKMAERERSDLRSWIESTWLLLGGPACLSDQADLDDAQAFFKLLSEMEQQHRVINLDKLKEKIDDLFASTQHDDATLQIMTIHTAKGLEFDTVILPHLERKASSDDKALMLWMERPLSNDQIALLLAPIHGTGHAKDAIYEYINRQQRIKANYETDRLLYVATTRAKKRLHLFFNAERKEDGTYRIESGSFIEKLWPFLANQQIEIMTSASPPTQPAAVLTRVSRPIQRVQANWRNPIQMSVSTSNAHQQATGFQLINTQAKLIGILTHRVLQQFVLQGVAWWQGIPNHQQKDYLMTRLRQLGVDKHALSIAADKTLTIIQNMLNDERGKWILTQHRDSHAELALTAQINEQVTSMVIDRTFVDADDVRWIIDYKTATLTDSDLEHFLQHELKKYREQMQKYGEAFKLRESRAVRLGLYFPALPAWYEWA